MLWEIQSNVPTKLTMPYEQLWALLNEGTVFDCELVSGQLPPQGRPLRVTTLCPVWWNTDMPERILVEIGGDEKAFLATVLTLSLDDQFKDRYETLREAVMRAETLAGTTSPFLLAALGSMQGEPPAVICWSRPGFSLALTQALFHYKPKP